MRTEGKNRRRAHKRTNANAEPRETGYFYRSARGRLALAVVILLHLLVRLYGVIGKKRLDQLVRLRWRLYLPEARPCQLSNVKESCTPTLPARVVSSAPLGSSSGPGSPEIAERCWVVHAVLQLRE